MQVKITRCPSQSLWYNSFVGQIFSAYREYDDSYLVRTPDGYSNIIFKTDCEAILKGEQNAQMCRRTSTNLKTIQSYI